MNRPRISVVIVNYNVKEYLAQALHSLQRALKDIPHEIFVVDNASVDGSVAYIRQHFPDVHLIESRENLGFAKANNLALQHVQGEYVVLINPDTVVQEDTFQKLLDFFEKTPDASAATCKIINPDGTFSVDCRHAIPTPMIAFWKVTGLSRLFPRSRIFGQYNLTYLDPNETYPVPAISGSFMMIKKAVLDRVGHFDERFFMYCEDIDLCHRINLEGFKIYYVPTTQIIHYKGESTKKNNLDYVITFNKALYQFFQKYYAQKSLFLFRWIIVLGIIFRGIFIYIKNFLEIYFPLVLDVALLNGVVLVSFVVRMELKHGFHWENFWSQYWVINGISTLIFLAVAFYLQVYPHKRLSIQEILKANGITFLLLAALTFFFKQFAFSRMVVLFAAVLSPVVMLGWRALLRRFYRGDTAAWGRDLFVKPTVLVGDGPETLALFKKIRSLRDVSYELRGVVTLNDSGEVFEQENIPVLGQLERLGEVIRIHRIRQVIFNAPSLSYEQILGAMSSIRRSDVEYKLVASQLDFLVGKSSIEKLEDFPLVELDYAVGRPFNRFVKRFMDIAITLPVLIGLAPFAAIQALRYRQQRRRVTWCSLNGRSIPLTVTGTPPRRFIDRYSLLMAVLRGKLSLVGAPLYETCDDVPPTQYYYTPGITGLVQLNYQPGMAAEDVERYHLFYLKNQNVLLDIEILLKALVKGRLFSVLPLNG